MNAVAFVIPYFGKFNNYFQLFLNSCAANADMCDWIIFTDDRGRYAYPENVKVHYASFGVFRKRVQRGFDFPIRLDAPYKLCDYRPAYGYLLRDYLAGYRFWGHCDLDLIWGRFSDFVTGEMMDSYSKIFNLGHCTLYRNTEEVNRLFMRDLNGAARYREVFASAGNCSFDEEYGESINNIFEEYGYRVYEDSFAANTYTKTSDFRLTWMNGDKRSYRVEPRTKNFFVWNDGRLRRYVVHKNKIERESYLYIHFQSRQMKDRLPGDNEKAFKIIPNAFERLEIPEERIDVDSARKIKCKNPNLHYFRLRSKNLVTKVKRRLVREE